MDLAKKNGHTDVVQRLSAEFAPKPKAQNGKQKEKYYSTRYNPFSMK